MGQLVATIPEADIQKYKKKFLYKIPFDDQGTIPQSMITDILKTSQLDRNTLGDVWAMADVQVVKDRVHVTDVLVLFKFVALIQNMYEISLESLAVQDVPSPRFDLDVCLLKHKTTLKKSMSQSSGHSSNSSSPVSPRLPIFNYERSNSHQIQTQPPPAAALSKVSSSSLNYYGKEYPLNNNANKNYGNNNGSRLSSSTNFSFRESDEPILSKIPQQTSRIGNHSSTSAIISSSANKTLSDMNFSNKSNFPTKQPPAQSPPCNEPTNVFESTGGDKNYNNSNATESLSPQEIANLKYYPYFLECDEECKMYVTGKDVMGLWLKSGLDKKQLASIWDSVDTNAVGRLTPLQFEKGMEIIAKFRARSTNTPKVDSVTPTANNTMAISQPNYQGNSNNSEYTAEKETNDDLAQAVNFLQQRISSETPKAAQLQAEVAILREENNKLDNEYLQLSKELTRLLELKSESKDLITQSKLDIDNNTSKINDLKSQIKMISTQTSASTIAELSPQLLPSSSNDLLSFNPFDMVTFPAQSSNTENSNYNNLLH